MLVGILAIGIAGCGTDSSSKEIRIGATAGPHAEVVEAVAKEAAKEGINVKVVEFSDYVTPDKRWLKVTWILTAINTYHLWKTLTKIITLI